MGEQYCIEIFVPLGELASALTELARFVDHRHSELFEIHLPDNSIVSMFCYPLTPPVNMSTSSGYMVMLWTALLLQVDEAIKAYMRIEDTLNTQVKTMDLIVIADGTDYFPLGNLGVTITIGRKHASILICAVSHLQNSVIRFSTSLHATLIQILKHAQGLVGLIHLAGFECLLLTDPTQVIHLDYDKFENGNEDVDSILHDILRQLAQK